MKLLKLTLSLLLSVCFITSITTPIQADCIETDSIEESTSEIQTREILKSSATKTVTYGSNKAKITLYYTYRYDSTNSSGKYITGVTSASISKVSGWYSVGTVTINNISYSRNHQVASVTVTYTGGHGEGNNTTCTATVTISLV